MKFFHGTNQPGPYFEGWYLKHQSKDGRVLALIPALHVDSGGRRSASLQVISGEGSWWLEYPDRDFFADTERFRVRVGNSCFCRSGAKVEIHRDGLPFGGGCAMGRLPPWAGISWGRFAFLRGCSAPMGC